MEKTVNNIISEALSNKGMTFEKLTQVSDIPVNYLSAIYNEDFKNLPPAPYVRGYLIKISEVLGIDGQALWQAYKKGIDLKTSGEGDKLPFNRFAFKKISKKKIAFSLILAIVLIYLVFQGSKFLGIPSIEISNPAVDNIVVNNFSIDLKGSISPRDSLAINGEDIMVDKDGNFEKTITLEPGLNVFNFKVKRLLGKEIEIKRQVIYQQ